MHRQLFISILLFTSCLTTVAQTDTLFVPFKKIKGDFTSFAADNFDNLYLLNSYDQLKKIDAGGDSIAVFNNVRRYGKLAQIDVTNPLRVLLYYKDFSTIVVLDRLLSNRSTIDLRKQDIFQVEAVCLSYDNKIWLYDEFEHKLKKIDEDGKLLFATTDFRQLFDEAFSFTSICDQDGYLYLYDKNKGVYVFDYYGSLKNIFSLTGYDNFKTVGKFITGTRHDSLMRYQPSNLLLQEIKMPETFRKAKSILFTTTKAYALKKDELEIYLLR
ncbi:MAG TPA: hypothetical protein VFU29_02610 [Chitinophagaceae bacterium]|nr:hypothetical protein [Chitinophagaceae bacterium]